MKVGGGGSRKSPREDLKSKSDVEGVNAAAAHGVKNSGRNSDNDVRPAELIPLGNGSGMCASAIGWIRKNRTILQRLWGKVSSTKEEGKTDHGSQVLGGKRGHTWTPVSGENGPWED